MGRLLTRQMKAAHLTLFGLRQEAGATLVEVLAAVAILTLVLLPMLDFSSYMYNGQAYQRQLAAQVAASKLEWLQNQSYRTLNAWPFPSGGGYEDVGNLQFMWVYQIQAVSYTPESNWVRKATVTVTCETGCQQPVEVTVVTYIAKVRDSTSELAP